MPGYEQIECGLFAFPSVELAESQLFDDRYWPAYADGTFIFHKPITLTLEEIKKQLPIPIIWKTVLLGTKWKRGRIFYVAKQRDTILIEDERHVATGYFDEIAKIWICSSSIMCKTDNSR